MYFTEEAAKNAKMVEVISDAKESEGKLSLTIPLVVILSAVLLLIPSGTILPMGKNTNSKPKTEKQDGTGKGSTININNSNLSNVTIMQK